MKTLKERTIMSNIPGLLTKSSISKALTARKNTRTMRE